MPDRGDDRIIFGQILPENLGINIVENISFSLSLFLSPFLSKERVNFTEDADDQKSVEVLNVELDTVDVTTVKKINEHVLISGVMFLKRCSY